MNLLPTLHSKTLTLLFAVPFAFGLPPSPAHPQEAQPAPPPPEAAQPPSPLGKVLFSRDIGAQPAPPSLPADAVAKSLSEDSLAVNNAERDALTFTAYDLDLHLAPAAAAISVRAGLTVRNDGKAPLARLLLQISSSLRWDAISSRSPSQASTPLTFVRHLVMTDADHTGRVAEAVVTLPEPLAPGASTELITLYSGAIGSSAERFESIGAPHDQSALADWDMIAASGTALRGFGNVLWYPATAPPVFLGDGAKLSEAVGRVRLREAAATIRLRVATEYIGDPPDAAFFCGRRQQLAAVPDNASLPVAESRGIATAEWVPRLLGFRNPNIFVTAHPANAVELDPAQQTDPAARIHGLLSAVTDSSDALSSYASAASQVQPMLTAWLGPRPSLPLTLLDHDGLPFEDGSLLVGPLRPTEPQALAPSLAQSLTHLWIASSQPWIDQGLPQFIYLLWSERTKGRPATLAVLADAAQAFTIAEPVDPNRSPGQPLTSPTSEVFFRTKAAAVWWMLRDIVGEAALQQSIQAYRSETKSDTILDRDPAAFQNIIERISHKDLRWFFNDWVYDDRGLPNLSIASIASSPLPATAGRSAGWLVAVDLRNDGEATAEVPVTVRSATSTVTERLRVSPHSNASTRIVFPGNPEEVLVNDGSVPEQRTSTHTRQLTLTAH